MTEFQGWLILMTLTNILALMVDEGIPQYIQLGVAAGYFLLALLTAFRNRL